MDDFIFVSKFNEDPYDRKARLKIELIIYALEKFNNNKTKASKWLGVSKRGLLDTCNQYDCLKRYINPQINKDVIVDIVKHEIIILHCSASESPHLDSASAIRKMHIEERGFRDIGYHYFIKKNGGVQEGRHITKIGAHCSGHNFNSIGICLHGLHKDKFTTAQFIALAKLLEDLQNKYKISDDKIFPHNFFNPDKDCPVYTLDQVFDFKKPWRGKK